MKPSIMLLDRKRQKFMTLSLTLRRSIRLAKNSIHFLLACIANTIYGFPSRNMVVIGVTGTDGKTTTSSILYHILQSSGEKVALISTVGAFIGGKKYDVGFHVTTPSPFFLQKYIRKAYSFKTKYLVLEVTSHALDQNRVAGVHFDATILTNITHEHLDYHGDYNRYVKAKLKLLSRSPFNVVNLDDGSYPYIQKRIHANTLYTYSLHNKNSNLSLHDFAIKTRLFGDFNKLNALAAVAIAKKLGVSDDKIREALLSIKAPEGRQEILKTKGFTIIVDFAHTPYSFEKMLPEAKKLVEGGKLIHVFGAAGKRDFLKRPEMGKISSQNADVIILTAEDPRSEAVADINAQVRQGVNSKFKEVAINEYKGEKNILIEIEDRKEALEFALKIARKGDVVIATGKGHEQSMNLGAGEIPWDEKKVIQNAL